MKTKILSILPVLSLLLTALSCSRDYAQPQQPSDGDMTHIEAHACADGCDPSQFVHHSAVVATADKGGNVEYWECPHCLKAYSDQAGQHPLEGYLYTLPTKYLQDLSPLKALASVPQTKGGALETGALVMALVSLGSSIVSLGLSIDSMTSTASKIKDAYTDLEIQAVKTQEELDQMEAYYRQIEDCIDSLMLKSVKLDSSFDELCDALETFDASLEEIDRTLLSLTSAISKIAEDVRADRIIDDRHLLRTKLMQPVNDCFTSLSDYIQRDFDGLYWAEDFKDTLEVFRTFTAHQTKVIDEWALTDDDRVSEIMTLITTFNTVSYNYKETTPSFLEQYANNHIAWEHLGFMFRRSYLLQDDYLMSMGKNLSKMYFTLNKDIDKVYAAKKYELMTEQYSRARKLISEDSLKMAQAYAGHRLCNTNGKKYSTRPHLVSFTDFCDKYIQVEGTKYTIYPQTYNYILYDMPEDSSISREDVELMERFYFGTARTMDDLYFGRENGGLELAPEKALSDPQLVVPYATDEPVVCAENTITLVCSPETGDYFQFPFVGNFHNPFLSSDFLCGTSKSYYRSNSVFEETAWKCDWGSYPACFTPIYYSETITE